MLIKVVFMIYHVVTTVICHQVIARSFTWGMINKGITLTKMYIVVGIPFFEWMVFFLGKLWLNQPMNLENPHYKAEGVKSLPKIDIHKEISVSCILDNFSDVCVVDTSTYLMFLGKF